MNVKRTADSIMRLADPLPDNLRPVAVVAATDPTAHTGMHELTTTHSPTAGKSRRSRLTLVATSAVIAAGAVLVGLAVLLPNSNHQPAAPVLSGAASSTPTATHQQSVDPRVSQLRSQAASQAKLVQCEATASQAFAEMTTLYNRALASGDSATQANQQALAGLKTLAAQPVDRPAVYPGVRAAWNRHRADILAGRPFSGSSIC